MDDHGFYRGFNHPFSINKSLKLPDVSFPWLADGIFLKTTHIRPLVGDKFNCINCDYRWVMRNECWCEIGLSETQMTLLLRKPNQFDIKANRSIDPENLMKFKYIFYLLKWLIGLGGGGDGRDWLSRSNWDWPRSPLNLVRNPSYNHISHKLLKTCF